MLSVSRPIAGPEQSGHGHSVRRRKFIDQRLQGVLLVCLIALELGMLLAAMVYLYVQFSAAIEANLFTIHRSSQTPLLPTFLKEMAWVVVVMGAVNTTALIIANQIWVKQIKRVTSSFRQRLSRIESLDLRQPEEALTAEHEVLALLERWRVAEADRARHLDGLLTELAQAGDENPPNRDRQERLLVAIDRVIQDTR